jgi:hypothetical protein
MFLQPCKIDTRLQRGISHLTEREREREREIGRERRKFKVFTENGVREDDSSPPQSGWRSVYEFGQARTRGRLPASEGTRKHVRVTPIPKRLSTDDSRRDEYLRGDTRLRRMLQLCLSPR